MRRKSWIHETVIRGIHARIYPEGVASCQPTLTSPRFLPTIYRMKTADKSLIPPKLLADLQEAMGNAAMGIRDPEVAKKACKDMDRMREELRKKVGILDVAADLVRETRDEL